MATDLHALHQLAQRQHGVFSRGQAERFGLSESTWFRWRRSGRIIEPAAGVGHFVGITLDFHGSVLAAILASSTPSFASHRTAAVLHGCWSAHDGPAPVELTIGRRATVNRTDATIHRPRDFNAIAPVRLHRIPTTDAVRTLTDLGQVINDDALRSTVFAFLRKQLVTIETLQCAAAERSSQGRVSAAALTRVLAASTSGSGFVASELEREVLQAVVDAGLPPPVVNFRIVAGGRQYIVDLAWPQWRVAIELDSREFHLHTFDTDRERDVNLKLAGWEIHRFTWTHATRQRSWMTNAIHQTLRSRGLAA